MIRLAALACGLLCGAGLLVSGLHSPALAQEIHARDGAALAFGLALFAAVFVAALLAQFSRGRSSPFLGGEMEPLPTWAGRTPLVSALVFGLGWGLAGYFPLTALVSAAALSPGAAVFLVSALAGMILVDLASGRRRFGGG